MAKRVKLSPKLDTAASAALLAKLREVGDGDIVIDASAVDMLGARCLEILLGAAAIRRADGQTVTVEAPSPQLIENLGRFGLTPDTLAAGAA